MRRGRQQDGRGEQDGYIWDIPQLSSEERYEKWQRELAHINTIAKSNSKAQRIRTVDNYSYGRTCPFCVIPIMNQSSACIVHLPYLQIIPYVKYIDIQRLMHDICHGTQPIDYSNYIKTTPTNLEDLRYQLEQNQSHLHIINGCQISYDEAQLLLRFMIVSAIGQLLGVSNSAFKKFVQLHFDIDVNRFQKFHIWNIEFGCYEYVDILPVSWEEVESALQETSYITFLAKKFHVHNVTMKKYLEVVFGKEKVQNAINRAQGHIAVRDITEDKVYSNIGSLARYLLESTSTSDVPTCGRISTVSHQIRDALMSSTVSLRRVPRPFAKQ